MSNAARSENDVVQSIEELSGLRCDARTLGYLRQSEIRNRLLTAIDAKDGEAVLAYVTRAVTGGLKQAGFTGHLTPTSLCNLVQERGWAPIHAAIATQPNALEALGRALGAGTGANRPPSRDGAAAPAAPAAPAAAARQPAAPAPGGVRRSESAPPADQSRAPAPGGVQRRNADNVRSIQPARERQQQQRAETAPRRSQHGDQDAPQGTQARTYDQKKVHGGRGALTIEADETRGGQPTVRIEAARMKNQAERTYDWANKIAVQLTGYELQVVTALLLGYTDHCKFQNHGPEQNKWFEFQRQEGDYAGTVKVAIGQGSDMVLVQVTFMDMADLTALFVRRVAEQLKLAGQDQQDLSALVPAVLRPAAHAYAAHSARAAQRSSGGQRARG